jgi:hypothetical protein
MRKEKPLIALLRGLVDLLVKESDRNPAFAARVEALLCGLPDRTVRAEVPKSARSSNALPDVHAEWTNRGQAGFRLWLQDQPISILREVIRRQDLDPTRRTTKWKEPERLAQFIADGLSARLARGSAFMGQRPPG